MNGGRKFTNKSNYAKNFSDESKIVEALLLFQNGLPNDETWVNRAKEYPNFSNFLPYYTPQWKDRNVNLFIDFLRNRTNNMRKL